MITSLFNPFSTCGHLTITLTVYVLVEHAFIKLSLFAVIIITSFLIRISDRFWDVAVWIWVHSSTKALVRSRANNIKILHINIFMYLFPINNFSTYDFERK